MLSVVNDPEPVPVGLTSMPTWTEAFRTKVLSSVEKVPLVQAVPGSLPILPKISILTPFLDNATASSPLKVTAALLVEVPP